MDGPIGSPCSSTAAISSSPFATRASSIDSAGTVTLMDTRAHALDDDAVRLVVGVTSHRDLVAQDVAVLREQVRETLSSLRATFPELALTIVSPLAEGGDQLVAEVGLEL